MCLIFDVSLGGAYEKIKGKNLFVKNKNDDVILAYL